MTESLPSAAPEALGLDPERLARISRWMRNYTETGKLAGVSVALIRDGHVAFRDSCGYQDVVAQVPMSNDTLVRIYSMTKPLTTVAALMLYEQGLFQLDDPVTRFIPEFSDLQVWTSGAGDAMQTCSASRPFTIRELMNHTSGLTYGFINATPVDALYREQGLDFQTADKPLAELVAQLAQMPLLAQPGTEWNYSVSTDVLGYLVELWSGQDLQTFLHEHVFAPLGMQDTGFHVPEDKWSRFAANYCQGRDGNLKQIDAGAGGGRYAQPAVTFSGGGGLVSSINDYLRFAQMMLNEGSLDGHRLLSRKTVELMTSNHLPGDMAAMGQPRFSESSYEGIGFGLGFSVMLDPAVAQVIGSPGEFAWGGAASTAFWIDPQENQAVVFFTQFMPSSHYPLRRELRVLSYQAIAD
jgi:CubicO group peptidase (beta-lactamase class C family)